MYFVSRMSKYFSLYLTLFKMNLSKTMAYRGNFLLFFFLTICESLVAFFVIVILYGHVENIAGWEYHDMLLLTGTFMLSNGISWLIFKAGISDFDRVINAGDFDWYIIKPVDAQFLASVRRIDIDDTGRLVLGFIIIVMNFPHGDLLSSVIKILLYLFLFFCGQAVLYSILLALKTISFKSIEGWATNAIAWRFQDLAQFPTDIYRGVVRIIYLFVVPLAFVVTVPAKALTGAITIPLFFGAFAAAVGSLCLSRMIWNKAVKGYSSASS